MKSRVRLWLYLSVALMTLAGLSFAGNLWWTKYRNASFETQCRSAKVRQDWKTLSGISEQWTNWNPESGQAWAMRALAAHESGDLPATASFLERIPDRDPIAVPSLIELTGLYFEPLRQPLDGVRTCERILKINPEIVAAHQRLIHYFAMTLDRGRALRQLKMAVEQRAESVDSYCVFVTLPDLVFDDALGRVKSWLEVAPEEPSLLIASALLRTRDDSVISGNDYEATMIRELTELNQKFPENLEILTTLLELTVRGGSVDDVAALLKRSPSSAASDYRMWKIRSAYSVATGDLQSGEQNLRQAIQLNPMDWHNWQDLGSLLRLLNKPVEAAQAQETAKFGKDLQAVLLNLLDPANPPRAALEGILEYAQQCGDQFVVANLSRRLGKPAPAR